MVGVKGLPLSRVHRSLGVHLSFVRSVAMDSWSEVHVRTMRAGGNASLARALSDAGVPEGASIVTKYSSNVAAAYRARVRWLAQRGLDSSYGWRSAGDHDAAAAKTSAPGTPAGSAKNVDSDDSDWDKCED